MKKIKIIVLTLVILIIVTVSVFSFLRPREEKINDDSELSEILPITLTAVYEEVNSDTYQEYYFEPFDSGEPSKSSHLQLANIRKSYLLLDNNSLIIPDVSLKYIEPSREESIIGTEKYSDGVNIYKLKIIKEIEGQACGDFSVYKNDQLLFSDMMCSSPLGTIIDWRMVNGKLALTYNKECLNNCATEIYYDGKFMSKEYRVKNPKYLFSYNGKIGFITSDIESDPLKTEIGINSKDRIFWDGNYLTPFFDTIQTTSCCSNAGELLPTVFENGVLLFFGERDNKKYLAEIKLVNPTGDGGADIGMEPISCDLFAEKIKVALPSLSFKKSATISEKLYEDQGDIYCELVAINKGSDLGDLANPLKVYFQKNNWIEDIRLQADGPTGEAFGYEHGPGWAGISVNWKNWGDLCPDSNRPIADCVFDLKDRINEIKIQLWK